MDLLSLAFGVSLAYRKIQLALPGWLIYPNPIFFKEMEGNKMIGREEKKVIVMKCKGCGKVSKFGEEWRWQTLECSCGGKVFENLNQKEVITK